MSVTTLKFIVIITIANLGFCSNSFAQATCESGSLNILDLNFTSNLRALSDSTQSQSCRDHEISFRSFLSQRIADYQSSYIQQVHCDENQAQGACSQGFEEIIRTVSLYRDLIQTQRRQELEHWYNELIPPQRELFLNCFTEPENRNLEAIQFNGHYSKFVTRQGIDPLLCDAGISQLWTGSLSQRHSAVRNNPTNFGLLDQEAQFMNEFEDSRLFALLDEPSIYNENVTDDQVRDNIYAQTQGFVADLISAQERIEELSNDKLNQLYLFQRVYEQEFIPSLSDQERQDHYPTCYDRSGLRNCIHLLRPNNEESSSERQRCTSIIATFAHEMIPFALSIGAYEDMNFHKTAWASHLMTDNEYAEVRRTDNLNFLLGLPISGALAYATKPAFNSSTNLISSGISNAARVLEREVSEVSFDNSRRTFLQRTGATMAVASVNPTRLIQTVATNQGTTPVREAILRRAVNLRTSITMNASETYQEALIRAANDADFSEVGDILIRRANSLNNRLSSSEVLRNLPSRVIQEGTQNSTTASRIIRGLNDSRKRQLRDANNKILQMRSDILLYLEGSLTRQAALQRNDAIQNAALLNLHDQHILQNYRTMLQEVKQSTAQYSYLYPQLESTIDQLLAELIN